MVAGGVPDKCVDHAQKVAGLALELVENAMYVKNPITGAGMQVRIGKFSVFFYFSLCHEKFSVTFLKYSNYSRIAENRTFVFLF